MKKSALNPVPRDPIPARILASIADAIVGISHLERRDCVVAASFGLVSVSGLYFAGNGLMRIAQVLSTSHWEALVALSLFFMGIFLLSGSIFISLIRFLISLGQILPTKEKGRAEEIHGGTHFHLE